MIFNDPMFDILFDVLEGTKGIEQKDEHHPEGDVFNHSLQVLYHGFRESNDTDLLLAAMLHDIGKAGNLLGHEKIAVEFLTGYVSIKTLWLIEHHMRIWYLTLGQMRKLSKVHYLINHPWIPELIYLARWDKMGRNPNRNIKYDRQTIKNKLNKCVEYKYARFSHEDLFL